VVTMTKTMIIKIGLLGMKITMISTPHHFMPHLVVNHHETDKCVFQHIHFHAILSITLFEEIAASTNRYVIKKTCTV
jgi:hypothetical protein